MTSDHHPQCSLDELKARAAWPKPKQYEAILKDVRALIEGEPDWIANTANVAAVLFESLKDVNWAGFYFLQGDELVLGPFQGRPACVRIAVGRGVCGTAVSRRETLVVPDVHEFPGHIACDSASNSEVVVPLVRDGRVIGVLDIDSPKTGRFDAEDGRGLEAVAKVLVAAYPDAAANAQA